MKDLDVAFPSGRTTVVVGPSGSGKSTLLNLIAGLLRPTDGNILFDGVDVTNVPPEQRNIGFVFQSYALFPHLSVEENVAFGLKRGLPVSDRARATEAMLDLFRLGTLRRRRPAQLSGGERQRVALARALARSPALLLLDEPLSALDAQLRERLRLELMALFGSLETTTIYVTHDRTEAMLMGHSVVLMKEGRVLQQDPPDRLYRSPANLFVARFFGSANLIEGVLDDSGGVALPFGRFAVNEGGPRRSPGILALVRPEMFRVDPSAPHLTIRVLTAVFLGSSWRIEGVSAGGLRLTVDLALERVTPNEQIPLRLDRSALHVLDPEGET
ncbi:MAG: ABC transporter ATP-binding protein [Acidobacteriota bacterium]